MEGLNSFRRSNPPHTRIPVAAGVSRRTNLPPYGGSYKDAAVRNGRRSILCSRHRKMADKSLPPYGGSYKDSAVRNGRLPFSVAAIVRWRTNFCRLTAAATKMQRS